MNLSGRVPAPPPHAPAHISETVQYQLGLFAAPEPVAVKPGAHKAVASAVLLTYLKHFARKQVRL
jgi:hypothetical protein